VECNRTTSPGTAGSPFPAVPRRLGWRVHRSAFLLLPANAGLTRRGGVRRWAKKNKVEPCFTPTYASWVNPSEAHFGRLRQFTLANSHHRSHPAQTRALHAYLRWRNANARHPAVLAAHRKERARIRSEKGIRWGGRPLAVAA
jgi:hypothetical protein